MKTSLTDCATELPSRITTTQKITIFKTAATKVIPKAMPVIISLRAPFLSPTLWTSSSVSPVDEEAPVCETSMLSSPFTTVVPAKTLSPTRLVSGRGSPVTDAQSSLIGKASSLPTRTPSAGTEVPRTSATRSPGTSSRFGSFIQFPSRRTEAVVMDRRLSSASALEELLSPKKSTQTTKLSSKSNSTQEMMSRDSVHSHCSSGSLPVTSGSHVVSIETERIAATSIKTGTMPRYRATIFHPHHASSFSTSLYPKRSSAALAWFEVSPSPSLERLVSMFQHGSRSMLYTSYRFFQGSNQIIENTLT
mmetsp:Transcript_91329/g.182124  ORF Transcript_91329/g.182124 Transcript_91329/m.182124 type:complete len:306 (+) Transcript_91329:2627-3544(+)